MNYVFCKSLRLFLLLMATAAILTNGQTALLFGANGTVGSEVLRAILRNPFWKRIVLVGRRFPPKVTDLLPVKGSADGPKVEKFQLPDLFHVDKNKSLLRTKADACFLIVGSSTPYESSMEDWLSVELEMTSAMARLCDRIGVTYVGVLSGIDASEDPKPFTEEEIAAESKPIGWGSVFKNTYRVMGLKEVAVAKACKNVPFRRFFQPSSIVTEETRYGWLDWTLFRLHKIFDPIIPTRYHSSKVGFLGMAFAEDAVRILSAAPGGGNKGKNPDGVIAEGDTRLTYGDFLSAASAEIRKSEEL